MSDLVAGFTSWLKTFDPIVAVAITGVLVASWSKLKYIAKAMANRLVATDALDERGTSLFLAWARDNCKRSRFSPRQYYGSDVQMRDESRSRLVMFQILAGMDQVFFKGILPILTSKSERKRKGHEGNWNWGGFNKQQITVRYLRGTIDMAAIQIEQAAKQTEAAHNAENSNRFSVHNIIGTVDSFMGNFINDMTGGDSSGGQGCKMSVEDPVALRFSGVVPLGVKLDDIGFSSPNGMDDLLLSEAMTLTLEEIRQWIQLREWYKDRRLAWKRGFCLHGPPGTGKTSFIRAVAIELGIPIYMFDLASLTNSSLAEGWGKMLANTPAIALFEDIDSVFHQRENVAVKDTETQGVVFNFFLSCLDGAASTDGVLTFITTNKPETLDVALTSMANGKMQETRPGRIDRVVKFDKITFEACVPIIERILGEWPDLIQATKDKFLGSEGFSPAVLQEECVRAALERMKNPREVEHER